MDVTSRCHPQTGLKAPSHNTMQNLELQAVIGFTGDVPAGLVMHPTNKFVLYPLGSTVVIRDLEARQSQRFLRGHSDAVSCLTVSPSGRYVASGQVTYMGFQVRP